MRATPKFFGADIDGVPLCADDLDWFFGQDEPVCGTARKPGTYPVADQGRSVSGAVPPGDAETAAQQLSPPGPPKKR
ncbi:hypothetical protein ACFYXM_12085 [Streptomyces sp. NPDC002476]|uniref:hypothetical protein n=1 Tax=Streptomyces sp. NPDC002476 TaxID=3364648 RepID=UPI0036984382